MRTASISALLIFLLVFTMVPLFVNQAKAQNTTGSEGQLQLSNTGQWWQINTSTITVLFPVQGQKPIFSGIITIIRARFTV
jgi:hypothetical protein